VASGIFDNLFNKPFKSNFLAVNSCKDEVPYNHHGDVAPGTWGYLFSSAYGYPYPMTLKFSTAC
jgi:hypothetical protein